MSTPPIRPTGQLPPSYPPAPAGYYYQQPVVLYQPTSGMAIFSGIAGIVSWLLCPGIGALAAVITGHIALSDIRRSPRPGRGWAIAGLVLGYLNLAAFGLIIVLLTLGTAITGWLLTVTPTPTP